MYARLVKRLEGVKYVQKPVSKTQAQEQQYEAAGAFQGVTDVKPAVDPNPIVAVHPAEGEAIYARFYAVEKNEKPVSKTKVQENQDEVAGAFQVASGAVKHDVDSNPVVVVHTDNSIRCLR